MNLRMNERVNAAIGTAAGNQSDTADRGSLQMELQGLSLDNVDAVELLNLNIQVMAGLLLQCQKPSNNNNGWVRFGLLYVNWFKLHTLTPTGFDLSK